MNTVRIPGTATTTSEVPLTFQRARDGYSGSSTWFLSASENMITLQQKHEFSPGETQGFWLGEVSAPVERLFL